MLGGGRTLYPKAFYLLYYSATASLLPFLILFYRDIDLSGRQIGLLTGLLPLVTFFAAPLWGELADATRRPRPLLLGAMAATFLVAALLARASDFLPVALGVVGLAFLLAPIMPMVDAAVLETLAERRDDYGRLRLWGAVGWGLAAPVVGALVERFEIEWAFYFFIAAMFLALLVTLRLPLAEAGTGRRIGTGVKEIVASWPWLAFLTAAFLGGVALSITHSFLLLYMNDLGSSRTLIGLALTVATVSEIPVFFLAGNLLRRLGTQKLLTIALAVFVLRMFGYSFVERPELVLPLQLLHGVSYALMWVAGVSLARQMAPEGAANTAQGLFASVVMGLGGSIGGFAGGVLYSTVGASAMFSWTGYGLLLGVLLLQFSRRSVLGPKR